MKKELPTINIEGVDFLIDVEKFELREKTNENNAIRLNELDEKENGYGFYFDTRTRCLADDSYRDYSTTSYIIIPEFVKMAPEAMAEKYNLTLEEIKTKSDFDLMVDIKAFDLRVNKGVLPTIDIANHTFYVDLRMGMLRPKDDFISSGIKIYDIDIFYDYHREAYYIPYDPKKHEFRDIDFESLKEIPQDLIVVKFPSERILDPVGWNRIHGFEPTYDLKVCGLKMHSQAQTGTWNDLFVPQIIKENIEREKKAQKTEDSLSDRHNVKKGRKM